MANENLGPAEKIIQSLLTYTDHMYHHRPGIIKNNSNFAIGVQWSPAFTQTENDKTCVYALPPKKQRTKPTRIGELQPDGKVINNHQTIGQFRPAGIFPEVATWLYNQVAEIWKLDNEFSARWASYAYDQDHRDLKVILAAFMLCQSRKGEAIIDDGKIAFHDNDYRDVGEAMILIIRNKNYLDPKQLLRIYEVLSLPGVIEINRKLGFGKSTRDPFYGRWHKAVEKWLSYREDNPRLLNGLVKAGFRSSLKELCRKVGYKPTNPRFFEILGWKQKQAKDGRRSILNVNIVNENWSTLTEEQICQKIISDKISYKQLVSLIPKEIGITRAILVAAIESGSLSDKDVLILTPTLEELGLLEVPIVKQTWNRAIKTAEDQRALNIATRVKTTVVKEKLQEAADNAIKKAVEEVVRGLHTYFFIDISGSMDGSIPIAIENISKFLQGFPMEKTHIAVFSHYGREIKIKVASKMGIEQAFLGISAGGGTSHAAGVQALSHYRPNADEDAFFIFVGDEEEAGSFAPAIRASGLNPIAFGFLQVRSSPMNIVHTTATDLNIPCFDIDSKIFEDPYSIVRTIRNLIASTPVSIKPTTPRISLIATILNTE